MAASAHRVAGPRVSRHAATGLLCALAVGLAGCTPDWAAGDSRQSEPSRSPGEPVHGPGPMMTPIDRVPLDEFYVVPEAPRVIPPPEVRDVLGRGAGSRGDHHLLRGGATYRLDVRGEPPEAGPPVLSPVVMQFTVPSGGWVIDGDRVAKGSLDVYPDVAAIRVLRIDEVGTGSCDRLQRRFVNPGPTPMDLANAIAQSYPFDVLQPARPVQAFGHSGVHITLQLAATVDPQRCLDFNLRTYRSMTWFSEIVELWILDVDGTRVVVDRSWFSRTSDWVQQQQQAIVETIRFVAP